MKKLLVIGMLLVGVVSHAQITKIEIQKPIKEIKVKTLDTYVYIYKDEVEINTYNAKFPNIKPRFSFTISLENYEALYDLTNNEDVSVGDTFTMHTTDSETIVIIFTKVWGMKKPMAYVYVNDKQLPYNLFYGHFKQKFFNKNNKRG